MIPGSAGVIRKAIPFDDHGVERFHEFGRNASASNIAIESVRAIDVEASAASTSEDISADDAFAVFIRRRNAESGSCVARSNGATA